MRIGHLLQKIQDTSHLSSFSLIHAPSAPCTHRLFLGHIEHLAAEGSGGADLYGDDGVVVCHEVSIGVPWEGLFLVLP